MVRSLWSRKIRVFLVDDERPARDRLQSFLSAHPQIEIIGTAGDFDTAAVLCARLLPDVVFLEVQPPGGSGFELLPRLVGNPAVVFVTALEQFAVQAFAVNAVDYLLKPIQPDRLALTLGRLAARLAEEEPRLSVVPFHSITHILAEGNYTKVYQTGRPPVLLRRSLAEWAHLLPPKTFLRVDRSLIACITAVKSLEIRDREHSRLVMKGSTEGIFIGRAALLRLQHRMVNSKVGSFIPDLAISSHPS